jgi:DNA polymerase III sliding clamp (beta) subunit (PCNA family)
MEFRISRSALSSAASLAKLFATTSIAKGGRKPMRLVVGDGADGVVFIGKNEFAEFTIVEKAEITVAGDCIIDMDLFGKIVQKIPGGIVEVKLSDNILELYSGAYKVRLNTLTKYNSFVPKDTKFGEAVDFGPILDCIGKLLWAVNKKNSPGADYSTECIFIGKNSKQSGVTDVAATDRFVFPVIEVPLAVPFDSILVPHTVVPAFQKLDSEGATIAVGNNMIKVTAPHWSIVSSTVNGNFPKYTKLFANLPILDSISFSDVDLVSILKRVGVLTDGTRNAVSINIEKSIFDEDVATLVVGAVGEGGEIEEELHLNEAPSIQMSFVVNSASFIEALELAGDGAKLTYGGSASPILIENTDQSFRCLLTTINTL